MDSALLSSHEGYLLEPIEWPKGSQASRSEEHTSELQSRAEVLLFLHGLESNPESSLQTEEEA